MCLLTDADTLLTDVLRDAARMSVVKINAVTVPEGMGDDFMERFAKRAGSVESQPGFEEFLLLKPTDGTSPFYVFTPLGVRRGVRGLDGRQRLPTGSRHRRRGIG